MHTPSLSSSSQLFPLLALDTSGDTFQLGLSTAPEQWAYRYSVVLGQKLSHSAVLMPQVALALDAAKLQAKQLSSIAVCLGPGSFTGIRTGVCSVRGLMQALPQLQVYGFNTLELLATQQLEAQPHLHNHLHNKTVYALTDARRGYAYVALFTFTERGELQAQSQAKLQAYEDFSASLTLANEACLIFASTALLEKLSPLLEAALAAKRCELYPYTELAQSPQAMLSLLLRGQHQALTVDELLPLYLQQPNITVKHPLKP